MFVFVFIRVRSGGHTAGFKGRHSLFDGASADAANLFEVAAILVECSRQMGTAGCVILVLTEFVPVR